MSQQWPCETLRDTRQAERDSEDFKQLLTEILEACSDDMLEAFENIVGCIIHGNLEILDVKARVLTIIPASWNEDELYVNLLVSWMKAKALADSPTVDTWGKIRQLGNCPYVLDVWLIDAMTVCEQSKIDVRESYISLAKFVLYALANGTLKAVMSRNQDLRAQAQLYWQRCTDQLDEIWWELRNWDVLNYEDEFAIFRIFYDLDPKGFIHEASLLRDPHLLTSMLSVNGIGGFTPNYESWERFAIQAPIAFLSDGTWNGSLLMPLLLVDARNQIIRAGLELPRGSEGEVESELVKVTSAPLITSVVNLLANRRDASPLFARFSTWLMRKVLESTREEIEEPRNAGYFDSELLNAIGNILPSCPPLACPPEDASPWEHWSYRCALASHAHSGVMDAPDVQTFLKEWELSADDWMRRSGELLRQRAEFYVGQKREFPGLVAYLLAYPFVCAPEPAQLWSNLWMNTYALREIVEFGYPDAVNGYQSRSDASSLTLMAFQIGLALLDQVSACCQTPDSDLARSMSKLHTALAHAALQMLEIDDTLVLKSWQNALRHLATRRMVWEAPGAIKPSNIFLPDDIPTTAHYLHKLSSNPFEMLTLMHTALANEYDLNNLRTLMLQTDLRLSDIIALVKRLNQYNEYKYPLNGNSMAAIEKLARDLDS
jgi:hypothetical protein